MPELENLNKPSNLSTAGSNEANNFTKWVVKDDNLKLLSEAIGIDIEVKEWMSSVDGLGDEIFIKDGRTG